MAGITIFIENIFLFLSTEIVLHVRNSTAPPIPICLIFPHTILVFNDRQSFNGLN